MRNYQNRALGTQEIIDELIKLAKQLRDAAQRGEDLGLGDDRPRRPRIEIDDTWVVAEQQDVKRAARCLRRTESH